MPGRLSELLHDGSLDVAVIPPVRNASARDLTRVAISGPSALDTRRGLALVDNSGIAPAIATIG
jgi:hypothetical protein